MSVVKTLLGEMGSPVAGSPDPVGDPGRAFRTLYDSWVERGPFIRGKPYHSVRMVKKWLGRSREVRSLETKLAGQTRLQRQDASNLVSLFLERWSYVGDSEAGEPEPYSDEDLSLLTSEIVSELYPAGVEALLLPPRGRSQKGMRPSAAPADLLLSGDVIEPSRDLILDLFPGSDALVTISRARTLLTADPTQSAHLFRTLMESLCDLDSTDNRRRALIWVIDIGLRDNRPSSLVTFLNVVSMVSQFSIIGFFEIELWRKLSERVVVVVGSLQPDEIDQCYLGSGIEIPEITDYLPEFVGDRLFLEALPRRWLEIAQYAERFGLNQKNFWAQPTITAHLSLKNWKLDHPAEDDPKKDLRYFFHAAVPPENVVHCIELGQPGIRWSHGFRTVCDAAFWRLGWNDKRSDPTIDPSEALAYFRRDGFAVLKLQEFGSITRNIRTANLIKLTEMERTPLAGRPSP